MVYYVDGCGLQIYNLGVRRGYKLAQRVLSGDLDSLESGIVCNIR